MTLQFNGQPAHTCLISAVFNRHHIVTQCPLGSLCESISSECVTAKESKSNWNHVTDMHSETGDVDGVSVCTQ